MGDFTDTSMEITAPETEGAASSETAPVQADAVGAATGAQETGTMARWLREPAAGGISCGGWAGLGLLAGLLAVVADGMGGLSDGDKVSQAAVSAMAQAFYHA